MWVCRGSYVATAALGSLSPNPKDRGGAFGCCPPRVQVAGPGPARLVEEATPPLLPLFRRGSQGTGPSAGPIPDPEAARSSGPEPTPPPPEVSPSCNLFVLPVEDRRLLSLQGLVDMCFGKKWATMQDESGFYDGALLRARKMKIGSVARLLYTISDVLPQTASAGMILYKTEIKQLTEVVYTNFSTMTREAFFSNALNALPLNKAIKKRALGGGNLGVIGYWNWTTRSKVFDSTGQAE